MLNLKPLILLLFLILPVNLWPKGGPVIVVNEVDKVISINEEMAKRIFTLKEERWPDGDVIKVFIHPIDSVEHRIFLEDRLNMSVYQYKTQIDKPVYGAKPFNLSEVSTEAKMVAAILKTKGGVGYINGVIIKHGASVVVVDDVLQN